ncbi:MAG: hypothetical protein LBU26_02615, partial [Synergistaceae bacterium]|jgi:hypothetical protein|nr:hypothetical protein [Synergistaceae bacterium]
LDFNVSEKFNAGLLGYYWIEDSDGNKSPLSAYGRMREWSKNNLADTQNFWRNTAGGDYDYWTLGGYMKFNFTPSIALKGLYYYQDMGDDLAWRMNGFDVSPNNGDPIYDSGASAWKAVLDIKQDALKFTSLWLEYAHLDNNFVYARTDFANTWPYGDSDGNLLGNQPYNLETTKVLLVRMNQQWSDKWDTFLRYGHADYGTNYLDDADNWTVGVGYRLNDAVKFILSYDYLDFGDTVRPADPANSVKESHNLGSATGDDHVIRFRTVVTF